MPRVRDERGANRELCGIGTLKRELPAAQQDSLFQFLRSPVPWTFDSLLIPGLLSGSFLCYAAILLLRGEPGASVVPAAFGTVVLVVAVVLQGREHGNAIGFRDAMLSVGRCPWCAYDLWSVARDDVGHRTCPECGGIWSLHRCRACGADLARMAGPTSQCPCPQCGTMWTREPKLPQGWLPQLAFELGHQIRQALRRTGR